MIDKNDLEFVARAFANLLGGKDVLLEIILNIKDKVRTRTSIVSQTKNSNRNSLDIVVISIHYVTDHYGRQRQTLVASLFGNFVAQIWGILYQTYQTFSLPGSTRKRALEVILLLLHSTDSLRSTKL